MDSVVRIRLFGSFAVAGESEIPAGAWRLRKAKSLVKLLALSPGRRLHREQVMELLWPERDPEAAANNLHQALYVARRALAAAGADASTVLPLREDMLVLAPDGGVEVDVDVFETAVARARETGALVDHLARAAPLSRRAAAGGPVRALGGEPPGGGGRGVPGAAGRLSRRCTIVPATWRPLRRRCSRRCSSTRCTSRRTAR